MAKERKTTLGTEPLRAVPSISAPSTGAEEQEPPSAVTAAREKRPARARGTDPRKTGEQGVLYARLPPATKIDLDVAAAMLQTDVRAVVTALLEEHIDPRDSAKMDQLRALLNR